MKSTPGYTVRGDRIRTLRQRRFMRQEDLAKAAAISSPQISRIETGEHKARQISILRIARALGVEPESLIRWLDDEEGASSSGSIRSPAPVIGSRGGAPVPRNYRAVGSVAGPTGGDWGATRFRCWPLRSRPAQSPRGV